MTEYVPATPLSRKDEKSLWHKYLIIGRIAVDPEGAIAKGRERLASMRETHGANPVFDLWNEIMDAGADEILATLVARTEQAIELRRWSPFIALVNQDERLAMLDAFNASHPRGDGEWQMPDDEHEGMEAKP